MKKRSATKSSRTSDSPLRDEDLVFLVDENLDSTSIVADLRQGGYTIRRFHEEFDRGAADEVWLPYAGARGWIVLSCDARISREQNEREAVRRANVRLFVLTSVNLRAYEIAAVFVRQRSRIERISHTSIVPFIARVNQSSVRLMDAGPLLERVPDDLGEDDDESE